MNKPTPKQRQHQLKQKQYLASINNVIDYIRKNLDQDLELGDLAAKAHFSPYHFHRLFTAVMGETVGSFIQRLRLERAATALRMKPDESITEIALNHGYASSATFARAFKDYFGMTASQYRAGGYRRLESFQKRNLSKTDRNSGKENTGSEPYISDQTLIKERSSFMKVHVEVKDMPEMHVVYVRHQGPYNKIDQAFQKLDAWAKPRGLYDRDDVKVLAIYHDDPQVTDASKLSSSACVTAPEDITTTGDVGSMTIPAGKYAVARVEIAQDEFEEAWDALIRDWLPDSGFEPDNRPCYEIYLNEPQFHPDNKFIIDICEPVKPAV